jgi:hypothetical protein
MPYAVDNKQRGLFTLQFGEHLLCTNLHFFCMSAFICFNTFLQCFHIERRHTPAVHDLWLRMTRRNVGYFGRVDSFFDCHLLTSVWPSLSVGLLRTAAIPLTFIHCSKLISIPTAISNSLSTQFAVITCKPHTRNFLDYVFNLYSLYRIMYIKERFQAQNTMANIHTGVAQLV